MSRAHGKHTVRKPTVAAESPEGRQLGIGSLYESPLPGGRKHLANDPVEHEQPPTPTQHSEEFEGILAHGVPPARHGVYDRADLPATQRGHYEPVYKKQPDPVVPVPVVVVERVGDIRPIKQAVTKNFQAPAIGSEPVSICERDESRISVRVLNEDATNAARVGQLEDLAVDFQNNLIIGGALLPKSMTSYLEIKTQGPLYVLSMGANNPRISVIIETEVAGG